jgi:predicted AAA+ superfamily ATPase
MTMIKRDLYEAVNKRISDKKAIIIIGARQVGKTTFIENMLKDKDYLLIDCDDPVTKEQIENANTETLKRIIAKKSIVFFDEAQRVKNIGLILKIVIDRIKNVKIFVSGSSSLDLLDSINEPLTGRKWEFSFFSLSWNELVNHYGYLKMLQQFETRLIYGSYPDVVTSVGDEEEVLKQLSSSYLYKDILKLNGIRKPEILEKLLQALAFQVGSEVSLPELSNLLQTDKKTIESYIRLLEKSYIIFKLNPFSRNLRNEINKKRKIYFYDNGVRNAIISNFNSLSLRQDTGALWENFLVSERIKYLHYNRISANVYFWRTKQKQEIDFIEERGGKIYAYEFKFNPRKKVKIPGLFERQYNPEFSIVNKDNFFEFLS